MPAGLVSGGLVLLAELPEYTEERYLLQRSFDNRVTALLQEPAAANASKQVRYDGHWVKY